MTRRPAPAKDQAVFAYGTLMDPDILGDVLWYRRVSASSMIKHTIEGYRRYRDETSGYYYAVEDPEARIDGVVIKDLDDVDLRQLDRYESVSTRLYQRKLASVYEGQWLYIYVSPLLYRFNHRDEEGAANENVVVPTGSAS